MIEHDDQCESWWEIGAMASTPCRCAERATTDPAALTDEDRATIEDAIWGDYMHASARRMAVASLDRLIAALRASRAEVEQLRTCAEWARWHIDYEWPSGPTGSGSDWERFLSIIGPSAGGPPPTLT